MNAIKYAFKMLHLGIADVPQTKGDANMDTLSDKTFI